MQIVAVGQQDNHVRGRAARELIDLNPDNGEIGWNKKLTYTIARNADVVNKLNLSVRVGAAPDGFRWKRCWPLYFVKKFTLTIGGQEIWTTNSDLLRMKYLIDGLQTSQDWQSVLPNVPLEMTQTPSECLFDFGDEERTRLSTTPHDIYFEPLSLHELIQMEHKIPLVCLAFHDVQLLLETGSFEDCVERIGERDQHMVPMPQVQKCVFSTLFTFLDIEERRVIARTNPTTQTKHLNHASEIFEKPANGPLRIYSSASNHCSAAYIWITDEAGNEIPDQVLENLEIKFNNQTRQVLSGFQSRMGMRPLLPHPTLSNTKSQNLYYISYYPGRKDADGFEQGVNFGRIDAHGINFTFYPEAPQRMKIHLVHRDQSKLQFTHGMAGLVYGMHALLIGNMEHLRQRAQALVAATQTPATVIFENTDQAINIAADEKSCMITWVNFKEGDVVQQCLQCKKIMNSDAMDKWMKDHPRNQKCVHCQRPYNATTFRKGKAHLTFDDQIENEAEQVSLVLRQPAAPSGTFTRFFSFLGFGTAAVHPHSQ